MIRGLRPTPKKRGITVGVDVRRREIRVASLGRRGLATNEPMLARIPFSAGDGYRQLPLGQALKEAAEELPRRSAAAATVESSKVTIRQTSLPPMGAREAEAAIYYQLPRLIPGMDDGATFGYVRLGDDPHSDRGNRQRYIVAAVPQEEILALYAAFEDAGLRLIAVELRTVAFWRFLFGADPKRFAAPQSFGVLFLDEGTADLAVFEDHRLCYARALVGWRNEDEEGLDENGYLLEEVERSLLWYRKCQLGADPDSLIVIGSSDVAGICAGLTRKLGVRVYSRRPEWLDGHPLWSPDLDPGYGPALGLTLKEDCQG